MTTENVNCDPIKRRIKKPIDLNGGAYSHAMVDVDIGLSCANAEHTSEELNRLFNYDEGSGNLYWAVDRMCVKAGRLAGSEHHSGYLDINTGGTNYRVHRVIWCMVYGEFPLGFIDHKDMDRSNNRLSNLRCATRSANNSNQCKRKDNTSGVKGVSWHNGIRSWIARVQFNGKRHSIGCFDTVEAAEAAIKVARDILHKEFANHG